MASYSKVVSLLSSKSTVDAVLADAVLAQLVYEGDIQAAWLALVMASRSSRKVAS